MENLKRGNVLLIGGSGVGKSTLINALLDEDEIDKLQEAKYGTEGTTKKLTIVEPKGIPFRVIDTIGFEISYFKRRKAISAVKDWSRKSMKDGKEDSQINIIWFCVDGTNGKLFPETIKALADATSIYKSAPIIVVITKSFSKINREQSISLVKEAFSKNKQYRDSMPQIIPVVAQAYPVDENTIVEPQGIEELVEVTNSLMPDGFKAAQKDLAAYTKLRRKALAQGFVCMSAVAGAATTLVDAIKIADSELLTALEKKEVNTLARMYKIDGKAGISNVIDAIIISGNVSKLAKIANSTIIKLLHDNPKLKITSYVVNAGVAGIIILSIGEICISAFEAIYSGDKEIEDIAWINDLIDKGIDKEVEKTTNSVFSQLPEKATKEDLLNAIAKIFVGKDEENGKKATKAKAKK